MTIKPAALVAALLFLPGCASFWCPGCPPHTDPVHATPPREIVPAPPPAPRL